MYIFRRSDAVLLGVTEPLTSLIDPLLNVPSVGRLLAASISHFLLDCVRSIIKWT
jgi:2-phospho-L-lactate transferase/gluconeogenesis factor (CofD/UPF0052 family)